MIFEVWPRDLDSSHGRTVTDAADSEDAAQKFGQREDYETAEYSIVSGTAIQVSVREIDSYLIEHFIVTGEIEHRYSAQIIAK